jgi:ComEC/Rec2-related protein
MPHTIKKIPVSVAVIKFAVLAGFLMLLGSAQQFLIHEDEKRDFLPKQPIQAFNGRQLQSDNAPMFQGFLQHHDSAHAGLMVALLVGDTQFIESSTKQQYKALGLSHLLAVSGMHIGLIFQSIIFLLQITTRNRMPKTVVVMGLILIWGFAHIGQYSPSLLRACVMFTVIHFGKMLNEKSGALNALGISFVFLLIIQPTQQYHWGFILSHLAVLGIVVHHRKWQYITQQMSVWKRWIVQSLAITMGAQLYTSIFLLPLTLTLPTYFLLSNFILVPFFSILLFTCFGEWLLNLCIPALPFHPVYSNLTAPFPMPIDEGRLAEGEGVSKRIVCLYLSQGRLPTLGFVNFRHDPVPVVNNHGETVIGESSQCAFMRAARVLGLMTCDISRQLDVTERHLSARKPG